MLQGVESDQISGAEDRAFRARSGRPGNRIHVLHGHLHLEHMAHAVANGIDAYAVADEVWGVLGKDDPLSQTLLDESGHEPDHFGIGSTVRDDLQKAHVARGVEEMGDEEVFPYWFRKAFGHLVDR